MKPLPYPQPILLRLSDVSDVSANTAHRSAYVTTTLPAIVQGLRNLECQPDPFNEFQGPDALFSRLLAVLAGTTEYDAVMGNEVERLNALLAEQVEKAETLRRERDEARAILTELVHAVEEADELHESGVALDWSIMVRARNTPGVITFHGDDGIATPTPGAQA